MVELRWVLRPMTGSSFQSVMDRTCNTERVLQYRTMDLYAGSDGNIHITHMQFNPVWSDWQDVPVVEIGEG